MIEGIPFWLFAAGSTAVLLASFGVLVWVDVWRPASAGPGTVRLKADATYWRFDLLRLPLIRRLYTSRGFHALVQALFVALFLGIIAAGLFGIQLGGSNVATVLTWTYWWVLLVLFILLFGKAWCWVCSWDALAGWLERWSFTRHQPRLAANRPWPKALRNLYPATALFLGLTWLELGYGVTTRPEFTALLALLMFFITFLPALVFERRSFCRYGCLVGRISGLYALFAPIELRARDRQICAGACTTRDCYHGNGAGAPCPTSQFVGAMTKNTYCILCGECVQSCPHDNVALNIRGFGKDLQASPVRSDEAAMVVVMLAMSAFHGITMTPAWNGSVRWIERTMGLPFLASFTLGMALFLVALGGLYLVVAWLSHAAARTPDVSRRHLAIRYAYAFLPIALFYHFAHNAMHFFAEGGRLVPLLSDPIGRGWNLVGTASIFPGPLLPFPAVWIFMVLCVLTGQVWALVAGHRISRQMFSSRRAAFRSELPFLAAMAAYSVLSLWIIAQPMEMRTGM